jgi:DNA-nicking Smr family endonuclease
VDLHGLRVKEALAVVEDALAAWTQDGQGPRTHMHWVTG